MLLAFSAQAQTVNEMEMCLNKVNTLQFEDLYQHVCTGKLVDNDLANIEECRPAIDTHLSCDDFMGVIIKAGKKAGQHPR